MSAFAQTGNTAVSALPAQYTPGTAITVTITVTPAASVSAYAVEDQPPAGWTVSNINQGGVYDSVNHKVKWGLFTDNQARTFSYQATPPANASSTVTFTGGANFDGITTVPISGQRQTSPGGTGVPPVITLQPAGGAKNVGDSVLLSVVATGSGPLSYQWLFNGATLTDGARVSGSATAALALAGLQLSDAGNYAVVVSNSLGSVTSQVAVLNVTAPTNLSTAISALPAQDTPGAAVLVTITVTPAPSVAAYAVEDQPPAGWTVSNITQSGVYDAVNNKVKWGLFTDNQARTLSYQVTPPATASGIFTFQGSANFDGILTVTIGGNRQILVGTNAGPSLSLSLYAGITLTGNVGSNYRVEAGAALGGSTNWTALGTLTLTSPTYLFVDTNSINYPQRFYRAVLVP